MLTPDRWEAVERIFHEALTYAPSARSQFVDSSCGDDTDLKEEVVSLLAAESSGQSRPSIAGAAAVAWAAADAPTIVGRDVDGCQVRSLIGAGGMGEVYLADDLSLDRRIAIKLLPAPFTADAGRVRRFTEEARAASALNHPNIITVYRVGEFEGRRYIATEFIEGETIGARIARGPLPPREALDIAIQAAGALGAAHDAGIVHRDIKPDNLMVRRDGYVKVVDFGLAKLAHDEHLIAPSAAAAPPTLTRIGAVLGTASYMAPEQAAGTVVDGRADLFSLAVVLHEMLTGRIPVAIGVPGETGFALDERALPPHSIPILRRALSLDPAARYQTARELRADLERLRGEITETLPAARRNGRLAIAAAALALAIAAAGLWRWSAERSLPQPPPLPRLAVLPFQILGFDDDEDYLSLGMTDAVITQLGNLPQLEVRPTSSVIKYAGAPIDIVAVGRALGVDEVLNGLVQRTGDVVRVTIQLVDAGTGAQKWSARLEETAGNLFAVQDSISKRVAANLATGLSDAARVQMLAEQTPNGDAYRAYLQGRFYLSKLTAADVKTAMTLFQRAVELDPQYAAARAGLANAYRLLGSNLMRYQLGPDEGPKLARAEAEKALAIDDRLPEAILVLADVQFWYDWNWRAAEDSYRRALAISPNLSQAHYRYGTFLTTRGRFDEAFAELARAVELDPVSYVALEQRALTLDFSGRPEDALKVLDEALALAPQVARLHWRKVLIYQRLNRLEEALAARQASDTPAEVEQRAAIYARGDYREVLEDERASRLAAREWVSLAVVETALGEHEAALDHLELAVQQRDSFLTFLEVNTSFAQLRGHPRFKAIVQEINRSGGQ